MQRTSTRRWRESGAWLTANARPSLNDLRVIKHGKPLAELDLLIGDDNPGWSGKDRFVASESSVAATGAAATPLASDRDTVRLSMTVESGPCIFTQKGL
jgi:hypothetical protein